MKRDSNGRNTTKSKEDYLSSLPESFKEKFDYTLTEYKGCSEIIKYSCPIHGVQTMKAEKHKVSKYGCNLCAKEATRLAKIELGRVNFFKKAKLIHGDKYDYSKVEYQMDTKPIIILCPLHGEFQQTPNNHTQKGSHGCRDCGRDSLKRKLKLSPSEIVKRSFSKFGDKFTFNLENYENINDLVEIVCKIHGKFKDKISNHLSSEDGCPSCFKDKEKVAHNKISREESIQILRSLYEDKYSFFVEDIGESKHKVRYYCHKHKTLKATRLQHLKAGYACNQCGDEIMAEKLTGWYSVSKMERDKTYYKQDPNNIYITDMKKGRYKIGIAKDVTTRNCATRTNSGESGAEVIYSKAGNTYDCFYLETFLHSFYRNKRYKYDFAWKGHTEVFNLHEKEIDTIIKIIEEEISE
jgi:ribosomal protein S14